MIYTTEKWPRFFSRKGIVAFVWLIIVNLISRGLAANELSLEQVLTAYSSSVKSIESYDVRFDVKWEWPLKTTVIRTEKKANGREVQVRQWEHWAADETPLRMDYSYRQIQEAGGAKPGHGRRVIEVMDPKTGETKSKAVYNGEIFKEYSTSAGTGLLSATPSQFVRDGNDYSAYFENAFGVFPYVELFRSRSGTHLIDEPDEIAIDCPPGDGAGWQHMGWRMWLDPDHGFLPKKIEIYGGPDAVLYNRAEITEFHQLPSGSWVPIKIRDAFFVGEKPDRFFGTPAVQLDCAVDVAHSNWGTKQSDETFLFAFPPGTKVFDELINSHYVTKESDSGSDVDQLAQQTTKSNRTGGGPAPISNGNAPDGFPWLLALNIFVVICLVVLWYIWRRTRVCK